MVRLYKHHIVYVLWSNDRSSIDTQCDFFIVIAPWSNITESAAATINSNQLSLAEIQKLERERRSEQYRLEQAQQQSQALILEQQQQKETVPKWKLSPQNQTKSLAEIQAEESRARQTIQQISAANAVSFIGFVVRKFFLCVYLLCLSVVHIFNNNNK